MAESTPSIATLATKSSITLPTELFIDGAFVPGEGEAEKVLNPATGALLVALPEASVEQVNKAVLAAHRAFENTLAKLLAPSLACWLCWPPLARSLRSAIRRMPLPPKLLKTSKFAAKGRKIIC